MSLDILTLKMAQKYTDDSLKGAGAIQGKDGKDGVTPNISIGTVDTLEAGSQATATITGTPEKPILNLGIPKGNDGKDGEDGAAGSGTADASISEETNNAITRKDDGLYVEDKSSDIEQVSERVDSIKKYQKYVNTELDYCYLAIPASFTGITLALNTVIPFAFVDGSNMECDSANHSVKLKAGKTYKISSDLRVVTADAVLAIYDLTNDIYLKSMAKAPVGSIGTATNANVIYTPTKDCEIQVRCSYCTSTNPELPAGGSSASYGYFIVEEINRQIVIDPLEHVNSSQGIEDAPVGHIISYMGNNAPAHYLACDGTVYNIADYPYLSQHIIDEFGSVNYFGGDGETTFAVPDLRGEFLRGTGVATRNTGSGADVGEHQDGTSHLIQEGHYSSHHPAVPWESEAPMVNLLATSDSYSLVTTTAKDAANATPQQDGVTYYAYTSRPTNTAVLYCIKYEPTYFMQNTYIGDEETILWEGTKLFDCSTDCAKTISDSIALTDSILNYDTIEFRYCGYNSSDGNEYYYKSSLIHLKDIKDIKTIYSNNKLSLIVENMPVIFSVTTGFIDEFTVNFRTLYVTNSSMTSVHNIKIYKIVGYKTSLVTE